MSRTCARLRVDYDRSLADLVAAGGYDRANEYVTESLFPILGRGSGDVEIVLVCVERAASTEEVLRELDRPELRLGRIAELLALGAAQPELQRSFPIVALGSAASYPHEYRRIPFLWGSSRVRHLDLRWDEHSWGANIRFLTVQVA
ncbi:MAG: hypothetical protein ACRDM1_02440 [Gaiellaceae bacterium]